MAAHLLGYEWQPYSRMPELVGWVFSKGHIKMVSG